MAAEKVFAELGPPVLTLVPAAPAAFEVEIQYPKLPPPVALMAIATVYVAPDAGVALLGVAFTEPPAA